MSSEPVRLLMIEDFLPTVDGLRSSLQGGTDNGTPRIAVLERFLSTTEDAVAFFEGAARHGPEALRSVPLDGVLVDGLLPRTAQSPHLEFAAVEIAIRVTAIYDTACINRPERPRMILSTASPDPCDVRAFVAYGGAGVIEKTSLAAGELRRRVVAIVRGTERWAPLVPTIPHMYQPGFGRYLRGIELGTSNQVAAERIGAKPDSFSRVKNELRRAFDLPPRATDKEIVESAQALNITWIPLRHEQKAKEYNVRPSLPQW